uniref:Phosphoinositide 3-kinase regulatory subunit 5 n=1 Tax=Gasterosteus aculeatus aculeatus TaxID=481459 RepID=A0AAQ4R8T3_GASAC
VSLVMDTFAATLKAHSLNRCMRTLKLHSAAEETSMNRWSLEELVKRDPDNSLILLQQIIRKTKEVQEQCQYELVAPLAIMFTSTLLQTPYCPPDAELLEEAVEVFRCFLTWPEPYCSVCKHLLSTLQLEMKAPGLSFQRLVREEQFLNTSGHSSKTMTVLLMNPCEVPADFLSVAEQLSRIQHSQRETFIKLIKHAFQSTLGTKYPLQSIHRALQVRTLDRTVETVILVLSLSGMLQTLPLPTAKCYMFHWETDNFGKVFRMMLMTHTQEYLSDLTDGLLVFFLSAPGNPASRINQIRQYLFFCIFSSLVNFKIDYFDDSDDYICSSPVAEKCSPKSINKASARLSQHLYRLFIKSPRSLSRAMSLGNAESKDLLVVREKRSNSLPQQVMLRSPEPFLQPQSQTLRHVCFRRRPILSSDEDAQNTTLRVVVFGADRVAGKVARAYDSLRRKESACPRLSRAFKLQFYFVPVKRDSAAGSRRSSGPVLQTASQKGAALSNVRSAALKPTDSTNDIAHLLGMLDPWYERNTLTLLNLPANVVCQQTSKTESESYDGSNEQRLPILADLVLYYCRYAARPALIQLYQAELTLACGERRTEVFVHSLELGHTAGTRAVKAMGAASKRFGIDGDREAVPLMLELLYNRAVISGRSQWRRETKVCTSVSLTKACKNPEALDSKMECLQLTMMEVLKRQNCKSKKGYNQLSVSEVKVDKVQVSGAGNTTFAVCLDQDEKKILQRVTRCDISVCYKPDGCADWRLRKAPSSAQIQPLNPTFCSLLCLPIVTFSGALP